MENEAPQMIGGFSTPEVFADEAITFDRVNDTIRITFAVARPESHVAGSAKGLVAVGTLVMPVGSSQRLALGLFDYLKKQGLDPTSLVVSDEQRAN